MNIINVKKSGPGHFEFLQPPMDTAAANHLLAQSHRWREQLWVSSQHVAKVNMNEVSLFCEQQIIKMAVTHTQYVHDHTVMGNEK